MDASPIAIVGVSCRFASAPDPGAFWRMIMHRASGIAPLGEELSLPYGGRNLFDAPYPTHGALLGPLYAFVPREQDVPRELSLGENQDRYFAVQLAFDALADAGMRPHAVEPVRGTVRFGYAPPFNSSTMTWLQHTFFVDQTMEIIAHFFRNAPQETLQAVRGELVGSLPAPDPASFLSGSGNSIASGIARECAFSGGATTLDGGALSGIAAIRAAMDDLRSGRADVALAGALTPPLSRPFLEGVSGEVQFATDGDLVPFSRDAHGTVPGEGGAFFVLKREGDALAAHDRIYALVKGVACGSALLPRGGRGVDPEGGARAAAPRAAAADAVRASDRGAVERGQQRVPAQRGASVGDGRLHVPAPRGRAGERRRRAPCGARPRGGAGEGGPRMSAEPGGAVGSELVLLSASDTAGLLASVRRLKHFVEQAPGANLSDVSFT